MLIDELGIHTVVANPFNAMELAPAIDREQLNRYASQLMVASGLALRSFSPWHI
ncbi:pilus assembly protein PilM [Rheinheimera salexigens]|uniref:pilus assembly protein PilM n=1 Tax=Rheinheimera salexigens TaxID=1628148 RepID=UPI0039EFEFF8